jgi:hypothetical protein
LFVTFHNRLKKFGSEEREERKLEAGIFAGAFVE